MERNCVKMFLFVHVVDRYSLIVYSVNTVEEEDYYDIPIPGIGMFQRYLVSVWIHDIGYRYAENTLC